MHDILAARLEVGQVRHFIAQAVEVGERPGDVGFAGDGHQVQDGIGRAAQRQHERVSILQRFSGDDVARFDALFDERDQHFAGEEGFAFLGGRHRGIAGVVGEGHAHGLDGGAHGVGGIHAAAGASARAGFAFDVVNAGFIELASLELADRFEDGDDVDVVALDAGTGQDAAAVDEDAGHVEPGHAHEAAGHILVAATDRQDAVVIHAAGDHLNAIGDDLARDQAIAHALVAHHDAVGCRGRTENLADAAAGADAFQPLARQPIQMGVAGRDVAMQVGHADHGPREIVVMKADGPQHGPIGRPAHAFGGHQAASSIACHGSLLHKMPILAYIIGMDGP